MSESNETNLRAGIELAAKWVEKRLSDYQNGHGSYDPETGSTDYPGNGGEYVGELIEIAEGIRALSAPSTETNGDQAPSDEDIADDVVQMVCDMDDRSSPEDQPDMMLVTGPELHNFVLAALEKAAYRAAAPQLVKRKAQPVSNNRAVPSDARADSSYAAGLLAGWNFCEADDHAGYAHAREQYFASAATLRAESRSASQAHGKSEAVAYPAMEGLADCLRRVASSGYDADSRKLRQWAKEVDAARAQRPAAPTSKQGGAA